MGKIRGKSVEQNPWEIYGKLNPWEIGGKINPWEKFPTIFLFVGKPWELLNGRGKIRGKTFPTPLLLTAKIRGKSVGKRAFPTDFPRIWPWEMGDSVVVLFVDRVSSSEVRYLVLTHEGTTNIVLTC